VRLPKLEVVGLVLGAMVVLVLAEHWSKAVLGAPVLLALVAVPTTIVRLLRPAPGPRIPQRLSGTAVWLTLAAVLVDALPAERLFLGPRSTVLAVYLTLCGLLAARAACLPGRRLPVTRTAVASTLAVCLLTGQLHGHLAGPGGPGSVTIASPVAGEWYATQAGRNPATNHHRLVSGQAFAVDLVQVINGKTYQGAKERLSSYAAYDEPVFAPVAGRVVRAVHDQPDNDIGDRNTSQPAGNEVTIEVRPGVYVLLAHLRSGSVTVRTGEAVERGELLGRIGNSGNSSEPHLHLQAMSRPTVLGVGSRGFPLLLTGVLHTRGGRLTTDRTVELRRNDRLRADTPVSDPRGG
jgi:hypothetical protein